MERNISDKELEKINRMIEQFGVDVKGLPENLDMVVPEDYEFDFLFSLTWENAVKNKLISAKTEEDANLAKAVFERAKKLYAEANKQLLESAGAYSDEQVEDLIVAFRNISDSLIFGDFEAAKYSLYEILGPQKSRVFEAMLHQEGPLEEKKPQLENSTNRVQKNRSLTLALEEGVRQELLGCLSMVERRNPKNEDEQARELFIATQRRANEILKEVENVVNNATNICDIGQGVKVLIGEIGRIFDRLDGGYACAANKIMKDSVERKFADIMKKAKSGKTKPEAGEE